MHTEMGVSSPTRIRSVARGALAAAALDLCGHLGLLAGWSGYALGRSALFLGLAAASLIAVGFARTWNRVFCRWTASLPLSVLGIAGFALLPRIPSFLHPTATAWLDATLVFLLPALPLMAHFERRPTSIGFAALGAVAALLSDETLLLPAMGFGLSLLSWALVWVLVELRTWEHEEADRPRTGALQRVGLLGWGAIVGFGVAVLRPFLSQHLPPERAGAEVMVVSMLSMWTVGWLAASAISRSVHLPWIAWTSVFLFLFGVWISWEALSVVTWNRWPGWLGPLRNGGCSVPKTLLAIWILLALPATCSGLVCRGLSCGGVRSCVIAWIGIWAGTTAAERLVIPALDEGGAWESSARARLRHPAIVRLHSYALNPDGALTRYPETAVGEAVEVSAWQGVPWSRGADWARLETCEVLVPCSASGFRPAGGSTGLLCIGFFQSGHINGIPERERPAVLGLDPLPRPGIREERGRNPCEFLAWKSVQARNAVLLSHPAPSQGLSLAETRTSLEHLARDVGMTGSLWVWCDPRGLEPQGVRTTLATWRAAFPSGRVYVLLDGYAGPLIGLRALGPEPESSELEDLALVRLPTSDLQVSNAGIATMDRPLLHWESQSDPPPFDLPSGAVIRALARALGLAPESAAAWVLEGLARHTEAQEQREVATSTFDRIRVPESELDAYREALKSGPQFEPLLRHLDSLAEILYRKRDFDMLLKLMRDATAARPDRAAFHRHLGRAFLELLDPDGAILELEQAYCLDPGSVEVRTELSKAYTKMLRYRDAARLLESVWEEKPAVEIAKGLGLTYLELQDFSRARRFLEFVHARSPGDVDAEEALQRMNRAGR